MIKSIDAKTVLIGGRSLNDLRHEMNTRFVHPGYEEGLVINTNSPLVVLIGDNGTGKSTFLEKIHQKYPDKLPRLFDFYFNLQKRLDPKSPDYEYLKKNRFHSQMIARVDEEDQISLIHYLLTADVYIRHKNEKAYADHLKGQYEAMPQSRFSDFIPTRQYFGKLIEPTSENHDRITRMSLGQFQMASIEDALYRGTNIENENFILLLDEPEAAVSLKNRKRFVQTIADYAFKNKRQVFVATHEPEFCKVPGALIINLDDRPISVTSSSNFDLETYLSSPQKNDISQGYGAM